MQSLYGDNPRIIPKKSTFRGKKVKSALPLMTFIIFAFSLGAILLVSLPSNPRAEKITVPAKSWHLVVVAEHTEIVKAEIEAQSVRERGGAGYIFNDGSYKIIASVYSTYEGASAVAEGIEGSFVYDLKIPSFSISDIENEDRKELKESLFFYQTLYEEMLRKVESFEKGEITESKLLFNVSKIHSETKKTYEQLKVFSSKYNRSSISAFSTFTGLLEQTVYSAVMDELHTPASRMRYALCKIVCERYALSGLL